MYAICKISMKCDNVSLIIFINNIINNVQWITQILLFFEIYSN